MTVRLSTGMRNGMAARMGFAALLNRGSIKVFSGAQPATADALETGTLLGTFSASSGAVTKETRATGTVTLSGTSGSITNITVGGLNIIPDISTIPFNTSLTQTAADLTEAINRNGIVEATSSGAVVTLKGRPGTGVTTAVVAGTLVTMTAAYVAMGSGVSGVAPLNGLILGVEASGVIAKPSTQVWSLAAIAVGTAGWARFYSSDGADTGLLLSAAPWYARMDGSCGVGSGDFKMSTISFTVGLPVTMDTFSWDQPAS